MKTTNVKKLIKQKTTVKKLIKPVAWVKRYLNVREVSRLYPSFSEQNIRFYIINSQDNGFYKCIRKLGKRILINIDEFEKWVESHKEVKK